ncbi:MAG: hypothetical protein H6Q55_2237, partial [Deltaproteobacteria bacterium]|nr:hypothetical protein [Deltaproteobacteria bacterium]
MSKGTSEKSLHIPEGLRTITAKARGQQVAISRQQESEGFLGTRMDKVSGL